MNSKRWLQLLLGVGVAGLFLWLAFRGVNWEEFKSAALKTPWYGHLAYVLALFLQFTVRSDRWAVQVKGVTGKRPPFKLALAINAVAFPAVFLIPFRLGEFVRPYLCEKRDIMPAPVAMANSAVERILDGLVTTAMFGAVMVLAPADLLPEGTGVGGLLALAFFGGGSVVLLIAFFFRAASVRFWRRAIGLVHQGIAEKLVGMLEGFLDGLQCFPGLGGFAHYLVATLAYWLLNGASMWMVLRFMGFEVPLLGAYVILCFLVIGVMIPAGPGSVGTFHAAARYGASLLGVPQGPAAAFAVVIHAWQTVALLIWGGIFVLTGQVSLSSIKDATSESSERSADTPETT